MGRVFDIFFMKVKSSTLGILQRSLEGGGPQSCHGGHMGVQSLFAHTLNQLPKKNAHYKA